MAKLLIGYKLTDWAHVQLLGVSYDELYVRTRIARGTAVKVKNHGTFSGGTANRIMVLSPFKTEAFEKVFEEIINDDGVQNTPAAKPVIPMTESDAVAAAFQFVFWLLSKRRLQSEPMLVHFLEQLDLSQADMDEMEALRDRKGVECLHDVMPCLCQRLQLLAQKVRPLRKNS